MSISRGAPHGLKRGVSPPQPPAPGANPLRRLHRFASVPFGSKEDRERGKKVLIGTAFFPCGELIKAPMRSFCPFTRVDILLNSFGFDDAPGLFASKDRRRSLGFPAYAKATAWQADLWLTAMIDGRYELGPVANFFPAPAFAPPAIGTIPRPWLAPLSDGLPRRRHAICATKSRARR